MISSSTLLHSLLVYGVCLPLAVFLGYLLATPLDLTTFMMVSSVLFILMIPLFLRWHHVWLIASWNMSAVLFFLPGRPQVWIGMAALSLGISILQYALSRERRFLSVASVGWPLIFLAVVVVATARLTGSFGLRALGGEMQGGRRYFLLVIAVVGYFAMTARAIPRERAGLYVALFFLGYASMAVGNLAGLISPAFNFLFFIFPVEDLSALVSNPVNVSSTIIMRSGGLNMLGLAVVCAMLARYNLREIFTARAPARMLVLLAFAFVGLLGGFRSLMVQLLLLGGALFWLEGLHKTRAVPMLMVMLVLAGGFLAGFARSLPLSIQRTVAFLPVDIDPRVKLDAQFSNEWRLTMWREVLPDVPRYILLGKGYGFDAKDMDIARMNARFAASAEGSEVVGDYHNGPLSVIIPFGIFGVLFFFWFMAASTRVLYRNYKYGDPDLQKINTFLFAFFVAKTLFFMTIFGALYVDLAMFAGIVGLSISLNGGMAERRVAEPQPVQILNRFRLAPGVRKPVGA